MTASQSSFPSGSGLCAEAFMHHSSADATPSTVTACPAMLKRPRSSRAALPEGIPS